MAAGVVNVPDPLEAALQMWTLAHGLILLRQDGRIALSQQQFGTIFSRALWTLLADMGAQIPPSRRR